MERPKRKAIRLKGYDYGQPGCYFVTVCARNRVCLFGECGRPLLDRVVNQWEGAVTKMAGCPLRQKGYYEHVIRNEREYMEISRYINETPLKW